MSPRSITILGGGLTGLSSTFHLARRYPRAQIYLLEKRPQLGGWVQSERVNVPCTGSSVILEGGPRTLQPKGKSVLELINLLKLDDKVICVPKTAAAAKSRYLYIPASYGLRHSGLQRLPSSLGGLMVSPFMTNILFGGLHDLFNGKNRPSDGKDESIDEFLSRRFGREFAHLFGSALVHGIYAADSRRISIRAAFPSLLDAAQRGWGSVVLGLLRSGKRKGDEQYQMGNMEELMRETSVYSFKDGMQTLTNGLEACLSSMPNVKIIKSTHLLSLKQRTDETLEVTHTAGEPIRTTHAVSALPLSILQTLVNDSSNNPRLPHLRANPMTSVQVVNLVFPCPPSAIHPEGFGYLIPRPPTGYSTNANPPCLGILGTVFDSCSLYAQDTNLQRAEDYYTKSRHTKLTVMVGGPYGSSTDLPPHDSSSTHPGDSPPEYICRILEELKVHLQRDIPNPVHWKIWNNENCIPTILPGHVARMQELKEALREKWGGRLAVVSSGVGGVSVPDCVEAGRQVGHDWK